MLSPLRRLNPGENQDCEPSQLLLLMDTAKILSEHEELANESKQKLHVPDASKSMATKVASEKKDGMLGK